MEQQIDTFSPQFFTNKKCVCWLSSINDLRKFSTIFDPLSLCRDVHFCVPSPLPRTCVRKPQNWRSKKISMSISIFKKIFKICKSLLEKDYTFRFSIFFQVRLNTDNGPHFQSKHHSVYTQVLISATVPRFPRFDTSTSSSHHEELLSVLAGSTN